MKTPPESVERTAAPPLAPRAEWGRRTLTLRLGCLAAAALTSTLLLGAELGLFEMVSRDAQSRLARAASAAIAARPIESLKACGPHQGTAPLLPDAARLACEAAVAAPF